ncbi:IclR family transcriptional regulator [Egicoccus sp. AB-alg6-2]|uniref:IclR family transcriptional regulator n=1 Tax=Egicoccus sp. AB-alg6-2 TaxID=3242692 RepID=UPI00359DA10A
MTDTETREQHRPVKSSERTLEILEHLAAVGERRTLGELSRDLGIPKSSLHAILRTMQEMGWIRTDPSGLRFGLGVRALLVGASYVDSDDVVALTADTLDALAEEVGETVHLGRLDGADVVYLAKRESKHPLRLFSAVGRRLPAHATALGKAVLSMQDPAAVRVMLPDHLRALTPNTIVDHERLREELAAIRARGYAIDNEENAEGIRCIAVAIRRDGLVRDAISCSVPMIRMNADAEAGIVEAMLRARERAESRLGFERH